MSSETYLNKGEEDAEEAEEAEEGFSGATLCFIKMFFIGTRGFPTDILLSCRDTKQKANCQQISAMLFTGDTKHRGESNPSADLRDALSRGHEVKTQVGMKMLKKGKYFHLQAVPACSVNISAAEVDTVSNLSSWGRSDND